MVLLGSGNDSEQMPCRMQVAPRHLGFCPLVLILASFLKSNNSLYINADLNL